MPTRNNDRIEELMDDPAATRVERATLHLIAKHELSMQSMINALDANTSATQRIAQTLDTHISKEEQFQGEIHAGLRAGRWITGIAVGFVGLLLSSLLGVVVWVWNAHIAEDIQQANEQRDIVQRLQRIEGQIGVGK